MKAMLLAGACAVLVACSEGGDEFVTTRLFAMGTWVDVTLDASDANAAPALRDVESMLRRYERDYYAWSEGGALAALNAALRDGREIEIDPELWKLLARAREIAALSDGAFDPAVGGLVELWGFHSDLVEPRGPPSDAAIKDWLRAAPRIASLSMAEGRVSGGSPKLKIDLGGIAKGEAVDRVLALLKAHGIGHALVNAGGDLRVLGSRAGDPWRIGIQAPRGSGILAALELASGEAAFTSGDYERFFEQADGRAHHILDPRTGYPADHTQAITVVAADGVLADAAATALFVAGPARWRDMAEKLGVDLVLRVDADGRIDITNAMRDRLQASNGNDLAIIAGTFRGLEP